MTSRRERLLRKVAELSVEHGVELNQWDAHRKHWDVSWYVAPVSLATRQKGAITNVRKLDKSSMRQLRAAVKALRQRNVIVAARDAVVGELKSDAATTARGDALTTLLRLGLDAHPVFAKVAGAETAEEVRAVLASAQRKTPAAT